MYVLAAVVADPTGCEQIREDMRALVRRPRQRIHWRDEERADRLRLVTTLSHADLDAIAIVATPLDPRRQERARRKCMERLFYQFGSEKDVGSVWMESRTESLNQADERMVLGMRGARLIDRTLHVEYALSSSDPMLWAADVVAGAVAASYRGEAEYLALLGSRLSVSALDLAM